MRRELDGAWVDHVWKRKVVVNDRMQHGYVYYRTEPVGRNFEPGFERQLTPQQMLRLGVFGGKYMTDCRDEFPASWSPMPGCVPTVTTRISTTSA